MTKSASVAANSAEYLSLSKDFFATQTGTLAAASAGGKFAFGQPIPTANKYIKGIWCLVTLPITLTLPNNTNATVSPYAPFSSVGSSFSINGKYFWSNVEGTAFHLDEITSEKGFDPSYSGLGGNGGNNYTSSIYSLGGLTPGATLSNTSGATTNTNYTLTFSVYHKLQRYRHKPFGIVPAGDPENVPLLDFFLNQLVGTQPEQSLFVSAGAGVTAAVQAGGATVQVVYPEWDVPFMPNSTQQVPQPVVGFGLQINATRTPITLAGTPIPVPHRLAMVYEKIMHVGVNNQGVEDFDRFEFDTEQSEDSFVWRYQRSDATRYFYEYRNLQKYGRYLPAGVVLADFQGGDYPTIPSESPQILQVTPSIDYASALPGLQVLPAMQTQVQMPAGTALTSAYARNYSFGLVTVGY